MILPERVVLEASGQIAQPIRGNAGTRLYLRHIVVESAEVDLVSSADVVVYATDPLILVEAVPDRSKAVEVGAVVCARQKGIQEVCREGANAVRWDLVIREYGTRIVRIPDGRCLARKVAGALGVTQGAVSGVAGCAARLRALVTGEDKQPVFQNWTAERAAILISFEIRTLGREQIP